MRMFWMSRIALVATNPPAAPLAGMQSRTLLFARILAVLAMVCVFTSMQAQQSPELEAARHEMDQKQYAAAEQHYRKALTENPTSAEILTDLALSLQLQVRSADAIHYYTLALKSKFVPETYALLAQEKCRMGDLESLKPMLAKIYRDERNNLRVISAVAPRYLDRKSV